MNGGFFSRIKIQDLTLNLRLSRLFGNTPEFWLNAQRAVDLWEAARHIKSKI